MRIHRSLTTVAFAASLCWPLLAQQRTFPTPPPPKDVTVSAIDGVIQAGAKWTLVWQGNENADGIVGYKDGLLFAQEQTSHVNMLDKRDKFSVFLTNGHGPGAVAIGLKGQIFVVERTCTDPGQKPDQCKEPTGVAALTPERRILANSIDGKGLGRVNDLVADSKGGIYFTSGGAFYISPAGKISTVGENLRTNGIMLSPDEKTLYITNTTTVAAFDVQPDGSVKNQREFAKLEAGGTGDGMAVDSTGRLYVTTPGVGIHVFSPQGKFLGLIPTPRSVITAAFSGPGKKTLYIACLGAVDAKGQEVKTPDGVRNTAMSIYKIPMVAQGYKRRPK